MSYTIFMNPDTDSSIYTLFSDNVTGTQSITVTGEPSITQVEDAITTTGAGNTDIIFFLNPGFSTTMSVAQLADLIEYLGVVFTNNTDIFYLTNFMDNCLNRVNLGNQPSTVDQSTLVNYTFSKSVAPNGMGCVAATKAGWTAILNSAKSQEEFNLSAKVTALVMAGTLSAGTSQPLLVVPDLAEITDPIDALKTQYCRIEKNFGRSVPNTENLSLFWFVSGVSIVVLVAWIMSYYVPRNRVVMVSKY